jgi:hypothetical protein
MTAIPAPIREKMYDVMVHTVRRLFPTDVDPATVVKKHVWRNANYVGMVGGSVQVWQGWSANLRPFGADYRTLYVDYVENVLPVVERQRLYGTVFSDAIEGMTDFVFLFVTSVGVHFQQAVIKRGFTPRYVGDAIHLGMLRSGNGFLEVLTDEWVAQAIDLIAFQHTLRSLKTPFL